jgi:micrococcal nuclease
MYKTKKVTFFLYLLLFISTSLLISETALDEVVYVTDTGRMYHRESCSYLSSSKIAVSFAEASKSYRPCSVCNPPVLDNENIQHDNIELYRVNIIGLKNSYDANTTLMHNAKVIGHVDGDTVRVRIDNPPENLSVIETIRLLGVDTPETVHPNQLVQYFGKEASDFTLNKLLGRDVYLAFDWDLRDRYGRLLAYIYTDSEYCFNAFLIHEGFGHAYLRYPFQFMEEFKALEQEAKRQKRGLWADQDTE